jgi:hypothetical protein
MVIQDVVTRWNYTHAMIKRALMLCKVSSFSLVFTLLMSEFIIIQAVDQWVFENEKLWTLLLTNEQWILLEQLCSILEASHI